MTTAVNEPKQNLWWLVLLQGIATLILGFLLLTNTLMAVATLIVFMGVYWLIDGIFTIIRIFVGDKEIHWGWLLVRGIIGILAGLFVVRNPLWATVLIPTTLIIILGVQGIIIGVIGLIQAFKGDGWGAGILGVINIIFGLVLLFNPLMAAYILPTVIGIFGIIGGIILIVQSFRVRAA
jgi:uncharacterized membrane protein HdeD (DUF308 family)